MIPPPNIVEAARLAATRSPCAKSRRGVVVFRPSTVSNHGIIFGDGFNGKPGNLACNLACMNVCGKVCVHAEVRAIRDALRTGDERMYLADALHVKIDEHDQVVAGGSPSCWQCSREVLDVGLAGFWLYVDTSDGARWIRYTAMEFHVATLRACNLVMPGSEP